MTMFEKNMDVGLSQLYMAPAELDLSELTPYDTWAVTSWKSIKGTIVEFTLKVVSARKLELDFSITGLPNSTGKYIKPVTIGFMPDGIISVDCDTMYHGSGQYIGGYRLNSLTTNIIVPSWMRYKVKEMRRNI